MRPAPPPRWFLVGFPLLAACGIDAVGVCEGVCGLGSMDSGVDTSVPTLDGAHRDGTTMDSGADARKVDATHDAPPDVVDARMDSRHEASVDAPVDSPRDVVTDAHHDGRADAEDARHDSGHEAGHDGGQDAGCTADCPLGAACTATTECAQGICTASKCEYPTSCLALLTAVPTTVSGTYTIDPDGAGTNAPYPAWCDMTTGGGGWTVIFEPTSPTLKSTTIGYTINDAALMSASTSALLAFRNTAMTVIPDWASFPLTANWRAKSPFEYQDTDETVSVVITGAAPVSEKLRYGYANFPNYCSDVWAVGSNLGRICVSGTTAPYYVGWATGPDNYCQDSEQGFNAATCSASLQFTIAIR